MTTEHEAVQEILAGHALHALAAEQAEEAEALIGSHLPTCEACRTALDELRQVAGDLALATPSRPPPRSVSVRLRRELTAGGRRVRHWMGRAVAGGAAAALVAVVGWNLHLTGRVSDAEVRQVRTTEVLATVSHPASRVVPLSPRPHRGAGAVAATFVPGRELLYLFGSLPDPLGEHVYQVWLAQGDRFASAGTFVPERGLVLVRIDRDPTGYDGVMITEEPTAGSRAPSSRRVGTATF